jgi:fatty acid desaturase
LAAGAALAGTAFLAAGLAGVRAAAGLAGAFVGAVLAGVVVGVAVAVGFFAPVVLVATVLGAATFFGVVVREVPGDALEDVTEVEVAFLVVS